MKKVLLFLGLSAVSIYSFGQSVESKKKRKGFIEHDDANAFLISTGAGMSNIESLYVPLNMEYFASDHISIALPMLMGFKKETVSNWKYSTLNYSFGLALNYHLNKLLSLPYQWDFYLGANGGYNLSVVMPSNWNAPDYAGKEDKLYAGGQIGIRYYVTPLLGIHAEGLLGTLRNGASLGITLHF